LLQLRINDLGYPLWVYDSVPWKDTPTRYKEGTLNENRERIDTVSGMTRDRCSASVREQVAEAPGVAAAVDAGYEVVR
jgi:hypothetical protein